MSIPQKDIPAFVRRCYQQWRTATKRNREAEEERLKFYAGGDLQWREEELTKRRNGHRPWITINRCKPAVDQIEGDIRLNPPGPQAHPVGAGADPETADIIEGLIREVEYRSSAMEAYVVAGRGVAASGIAYIEVGTEYSSERGFEQRPVIMPVEDPNMVFYDPNARMLHREDAMWAGKLRTYSKEEYEAAFGKRRAVLDPSATRNAAGWIQDAIGVTGQASQITEWTGAGKGPYYVAEFYLVELEDVKLRLYSDNIARFEDEPVPKGVLPKEGKEFERKVPRRKIQKYVVDALEKLDGPEQWLGKRIPLIPVLGQEIWIDGKLYRLSLIAGAIDAQRALNYTATTATELAGLMPKAPWIGWKGQFDDPRWQTANSEMWAYLEVEPTFAVDEGTGAKTLLPAPQRNTWETPIQWLLALATYFSDAIKAVTAIYDPSLGMNKGDQSGRALEQLRSESSVGTFSYSDTVHSAVAVVYDELRTLFSVLYDGERVKTIVRPDGQHELATINKEYPEEANGKPRKANRITEGEYSVRVTSGPNFQTRSQEAVQVLLNFFKAAPAILGAPGVAAKFLRMVGEGNPQVEGMADMLAPQGEGEQNEQQLSQQLQQAQQQNQVLTMLVQKMQQAMQAKLPEIEAKKWVAAVQAISGIRQAEIKAGVDQAQMDMRAFEHITGLAHQAASEATQQQAAAGAQQAEYQHADAAQDAEHQHANDTLTAEHAHDAGMADKQAEIASQQAEQQAKLAPKPAAGGE
jgi:hypothetical protein